MFKSEQEALDVIMVACDYLGWSVTIPTENEQAEVECMIIGDPDLVDYILDKDFTYDSNS